MTKKEADDLLHAYRYTDTWGFIYVIRSGQHYVKIGHSTNPWRRYKGLCGSNAESLELVVFVPGTLQEEKRLHELLSGYRFNNEWFFYGGLVKSVVDDICRFKPDTELAAAYDKEVLGRACGVMSGDADAWLTLREISRITGMDEREMMKRYGPARKRPVSKKKRETIRGRLNELNGLISKGAGDPEALLGEKLELISQLKG